MQKHLRINIGCGRTPTVGWSNFDNSISIFFSRHLIASAILSRLGLLKAAQIENIEYQRRHHIQFCDARKTIPYEDHSVNVVYASHMVEHLDPEEAAAFLREARRVLVSGGTLRLALPNLRWHIELYLGSSDADSYMINTKLGRLLPKTWIARLKALMLGEREYHVWMYDEKSATKMLEKHGFVGVKSYPPGETRISDPGELDLRERAPESLFVEGTNP